MDEMGMMLDGNAMAGALGEIFVRDMTMARIVCGGCGTMEAIGAERAYVHAPGVVLRCRNCDNAVVVMVTAGDRQLISFRGAARLEIDGMG